MLTAQRDPPYRPFVKEVRVEIVKILSHNLVKLLVLAF